MAYENINHIYQFKRGTAQRWIEINPILRQGEPGFEYDTGKLKIGDGFTPWLALPYINEGSVFNALTRDDFPRRGNTNTIYKASEEAALYQWNNNTQKYELLSSGEQLIDELVQDVDEVREEMDELQDTVSDIELLLQDTIILYGGSATDNIVLEENTNA